MANFKRIICHWTAGTYQPNTKEFNSYHYLVNGDGLVIEGKYKPEDNLNCYDGAYAPHTGGGNTGAIGIAMCGMAGFVSKNKVGNYPLTKVQCERFFKLVAEVAKKYNLPINSETVMTHYEFGQAHPKTTSYGKIDIIYLPPYPDVAGVADFIRSKSLWYSNHI